MKKKKAEKDSRIKTRHFSWKEYAITYVILLTLSSGQAMIYAEFMGLDNTPLEFIFGMLGYWAIVSAVFTLITHYQIRKKFDEPMQRLSTAAKKVAEGDFSVYVEPTHTSDKYDYLDVMFGDFNKMVEELGSIETLKNDFIANVSHEIKTPLSVIQSYATALHKDDLSPELRKEYSGTIINASRNLTQLVTNILRLNKLENQGIGSLNIESFDLCRQLSECAISFERALEGKDIELEAEMEDRVVITSDASMLEIVWLNLLSNAVKFTEPGGKIKLTQSSDAHSVTVTAADTGCGMDGETMKRIFDKFYQGDTSRSGEGNGLGLALASRVIERLGGEISVKSEPGEGSEFTVKLKK